MEINDLAHGAGGLLSLAGNSRARALSELATLASRQVPGCSGASAVLWQAREPDVVAASHPEISALIEVEVRSQRGPVLEALDTGTTTGCPDTLDNGRWPEYAHAALCRGVRCSVTLVHQSSPAALTLSLCGIRPRMLDEEQLPLAGLLVAVGGAMLGNVSRYGDARRTALQLRDAARSRTLVDQAKGILMQALGCSAEEALAKMREISQQHNIKVTDVASRIIDSRMAGR